MCLWSKKGGYETAHAATHTERPGFVHTTREINPNFTLSASIAWYTRYEILSALKKLALQTSSILSTPHEAYHRQLGAEPASLLANDNPKKPYLLTGAVGIHILGGNPATSHKVELQPEPGKCQSRYEVVHSTT